VSWQIVSREEGEVAGGALVTRKAVLTRGSRGRFQESAWVSEESRHRLPSVAKGKCLKNWDLRKSGFVSIKLEYYLPYIPE